MFISSNQVYDGKQPKQLTQPHCPVSLYGVHKEVVERYLLASPRNAVLRVTKVLSKDDRRINLWIEKVRRGLPIYPSSTTRFSPVSIDAVVKAIRRIVLQRQGGAFQLSGIQDVTYYGFMQSLILKLGLDTGLVVADDTLPDGLYFTNMQTTIGTTIVTGKPIVCYILNTR